MGITLNQLTNTVDKIMAKVKSNYVLRENGKGLSSNDYTIKDKNKVTKIDTIESDVNKIKDKLTHKLDYFSISVNLSNDKSPTDNMYKHMQYQGIDQTLIVMVNINDTSDIEPKTMDKERVISCIDKANSYGIKTVMLKPHLGVNWSDGTKRYNIDYGNNTNTFLSN